MVCSGDAVFDTDITFNTLCSVSFLNDCGWGLSHVLFSDNGDGALPRQIYSDIK